MFTFEATRHIIPARPLEVDVPLDLLKERDISIEEANRRLSTLIKAKVLKRIYSGQVWWG